VEEPSTASKAGVYLAACDAFDLKPGDCAMVAAHTNDLLSAAQCGLRTAHIARPNEHGPGRGEVAPTAPVDYAAADLGALADKLAA
jgi:2-haloacid dehalogenase